MVDYKPVTIRNEYCPQCKVDNSAQGLALGFILLLVLSELRTCTCIFEYASMFLDSKN